MSDQEDKRSQGGNLDHGWQRNEGDGRLDTPTFHRNHAAILEVLRRYLAPGVHGHALEIGSGSGQHVTGFATAFPALDWTPSDPDPRHRESIEAWRNASNVANIHAPEDLDVGQPDWRVQRAPVLAAMVCINVLHIAPWKVTLGLLAGAERFLAADGHLFVYGPFKVDGVHTSSSNADFDQRLRDRNPDWGVRDSTVIKAEARKCELELADVVPMPANNFTLVLRRRA